MDFSPSLSEPLQIAERTVVGEDVEAVRRPFEGAAGLVAPVGPLADVGADHARALAGVTPLKVDYMSNQRKDRFAGTRQMRGAVRHGRRHAIKA